MNSKGLLFSVIFFALCLLASYLLHTDEWIAAGIVLGATGFVLLNVYSQGLIAALNRMDDEDLEH